MDRPQRSWLFADAARASSAGSADLRPACVVRVSEKASAGPDPVPGLGGAEGFARGAKRRGRNALFGQCEASARIGPAFPSGRFGSALQRIAKPFKQNRRCSAKKRPTPTRVIIAAAHGSLESRRLEFESRESIEVSPIRDINAPEPWNRRGPVRTPTRGPKTPATTSGTLGI
jgi:hypothetical protein